jgi:hypothetical protein
VTEPMRVQRIEAQRSRLLVKKENDEKVSKGLLGKRAQHAVPSRNPFSRYGIPEHFCKSENCVPKNHAIRGVHARIQTLPA